MREILFRGKRTDNREWAYGFYALKGKAYKRQEQHCICVSTLTSDCELSYFVDFEVIPETVGQYTGLTDKNGKKIFEGDIHKCGENLWLVTFGEFYDMDVTDYEYGWYCKKINSKYVEAFGFNGAESGYMNIIGNIHDNPELLKGGAE